MKPTRYYNQELSTSTIEPLADDSPFGAFPQDDSAQRVFQFARKHLWLIAILTAIGLGIGIVANAVITKKYTAKSNIEVREDTSGQFRVEQSGGFSEGGVDSVKLDTEVEILRSRTLAYEVIRALHLDSNPDFVKVPGGRPLDLSQPGTRNALIGIFLSNLNVSRMGHTNIIAITYTSRKPQLASLIANTLIDSYVEHTFRDSYSSTAKISEWLDSQLGGLKDKLEKSQARMLQLQKEIGVVGLDQTQSIVVANLEELNKQVADAQVDRLVKEARLRAIQDSPADVVDAFASIDPALQNTKQNILQLKLQYSSLAQTYGSGYPRVKALKAQIDELQTNLQKEEQAQVSRAQKEVEASKNNEKLLHQAFDSQQQEAFSHGSTAIQYELARREYESNRMLYDGLEERLQEAGIISGLHSTAIHVVDNADIPVTPSQPRSHLNLAAGGGIGLFLGVALAFILESLDTNLRTMEDIESGLQLPLLAAIPAVPTEDLLPSTYRERAIEKGSTGWSRIAEAVRAMRTSILLSSPGAPPQVIMVTSSRPAEGKTSVTCMSAVTFALNGSKTLLIDADLRRPSVRNRFRLNNKAGLSSILSGKTNFEDAVVEWPDLPNLSILPAGPAPPLPSELLGSKEMEGLLARLRSEYEFILIDTPPVLTVTDSSIMARNTDATILIVRYAQVQRKVVTRSVDVLHRAGAKLLGVVVNAVNFRAPEYADYYGRKYYEYYGERKPE